MMVAVGVDVIMEDNDYYYCYYYYYYYYRSTTTVINIFIFDIIMNKWMKKN